MKSNYPPKPTDPQPDGNEKKGMSDMVKVAWIAFASAIIAAIVTGLFSLNRNSSEKAIPESNITDTVYIETSEEVAPEVKETAITVPERKEKAIEQSEKSKPISEDPIENYPKGDQEEKSSPNEAELGQTITVESKGGAIVGARITFGAYGKTWKTDLNGQVQISSLDWTEIKKSYTSQVGLKIEKSGFVTFNNSINVDNLPSHVELEYQ